MIHRANSPRKTNEARSNGIPGPNTQPRLPPRQAGRDHGVCNHPRVEVERVGDPEADEVPRAPLAAGGLDWLEVVVHELGGESGMELAGQEGSVRYHELSR